MTMNKAVVAVFDTHLQLDQARNELYAEGFVHQDISVLFPDKETSQSLSHAESKNASEDTLAGVAGGAIIGGAAGLIVGLGALAIPGVGPFLAAGPIMSALAGATMGGTLGGISGALVGMGVPETEAKIYEGFVKDGAVLISVQAQNTDRCDAAKRIFRAHGAHDVTTNSLESTPKIVSDKRGDKFMHQNAMI